MCKIIQFDYTFNAFNESLLLPPHQPPKTTIIKSTTLMHSIILSYHPFTKTQKINALNYNLSPPIPPKQKTKKYQFQRPQEDTKC